MAARPRATYVEAQVNAASLRKRTLQPKRIRISTTPFYAGCLCCAQR